VVSYHIVRVMGLDFLLLVLPCTGFLLCVMSVDSFIMLKRGLGSPICCSVISVPWLCIICSKLKRAHDKSIITDYQSKGELTSRRVRDSVVYWQVAALNDAAPR